MNNEERDLYVALGAVSSLAAIMMLFLGSIMAATVMAVIAISFFAVSNLPPARRP